jgi:hypothetical protein
VAGGPPAGPLSGTDTDNHLNHGKPLPAADSRWPASPSCRYKSDFDYQSLLILTDFERQKVYFVLSFEKKLNETRNVKREA